MQRKFYLGFLVALLAATTLAACGPTSSSSAKQDLRVLADPSFYGASDLSPHIRAYAGLGRLLWAPLVAHDAKWNPTADGLAPAPDVSSDGLTYTFHLRKDAKYSDGTPITAHDVEFDLRYDIMTGHPKVKGTRLLGTTANRYYANIVGAAAVFDPNSTVTPNEFDAAPVSGVKATDDYTLQIQLVQRDPGFIYALMVDSPSAVKPTDIQRGKGKTYTNDQYWTTEPGVAFSGPLALQSYTPNQGFTLVPNTNYYGNKVKLQHVTVTFVKDAATAITAFQNREADWLDLPLGGADVQNINTDDYLKSALVQADTYNVQQLFITPYKPLDDIHVRRAIYMAINKQSLADVLGGGAGQKFYSPIVSHVTNTDGCPAANGITPIAFDPNAAKAELAQSKYGAAVKDIPINIELGLFGQDLALNKIEGQFLQQALQQTLGFTNVQIHQDTINDFNKPPFPYQLWPNAQGDREPDLYGFLNNLVPLIPAQDIPATGPSTLFTLPYAPDVTNLMKQAFAAPTLDARCQVLQKVLQTWVDQVVTIDLFTDKGFTLVAPWVKGLHTANGSGGFEYLYLSPGLEDVTIAAH